MPEQVKTSKRQEKLSFSPKASLTLGGDEEETKRDSGLIRCSEDTAAWGAPQRVKGPLGPLQSPHQGDVSWEPS